MPRTSTTTKAWKWKYSRLFSRRQWKSTIPIVATTRKHHIFDLEDRPEIDITTMIMPEVETTEKIKVLPFTIAQQTTMLSIEQVSTIKNVFI
jgi:hypothetical protein